jgi:hypothetical protein
MEHVRLTLDGGGREADVHPMYGLLSDSEDVERATAVQWNYTGQELGIMHHVVGNAAAFERAVEEIPQVVEYELARTAKGAFYAYVRDELTAEARALFEAVATRPTVVVPPVVWEADGTVALSAFGPGAEIQATLGLVPEFLDVAVREVGGMAGLPGLHETVLSTRQREAVRAGLRLGYYEVPREVSHEAVAGALGCAPSTAAEHLRKAESKLLDSVVRP